MKLNIVEQAAVICSLLFASFMSAPAAAQEAQIIELTVSPAAEPLPALRYALLPSYSEKKEGNAVTYYMRALLQRKETGDLNDSLYATNEDRWLSWPLDDKAKAEIREWLDARSQVFAEIREAAHRDQCDWGLRFRELRGRDVINVRLLEVQECRALARDLRLQARLAIAEHRLDDALESLKYGYQLALDVSKQPTLINVLVGIAIAGVMNEELQLLMQDPAAPNLHWAIAALPYPFIGMREAIEQERNIVHQVFPALVNVETAQRTPEEWQQLLQSSVDELVNISEASGSNDDAWVATAFVAFLALNYPTAKQELIDSGMPAEKVEAMPVAQVILIQTARNTDYAFDEVFKWSYLPYSAAEKYMMETERRLIASGDLGPADMKGKSGLPIARMLMPALAAARYAPVRLERARAALQTIEALRMYAAAHDGKLPQQLSEITSVPLPRDELTGEPLQYHLDGDAGVLELPAPTFRNQIGGYRYVVRIRR